MAENTIDRLVRLGGKPWQKDGKSRIYFNDLVYWYGLECDYYNSGNVASATLNGQRVSNSEARRILGRLQGAKVWYDLADGKFHGWSIDSSDFTAIVTAIEAAPQA